MPHESLPVQETQFRQFFRLVTGEVAAWFSKHSDPNPLGVVPPAGTKIIDDDKFEMSAEAIAALAPQRCVQSLVFGLCEILKLWLRAKAGPQSASDHDDY